MLLGYFLLHHNQETLLYALEQYPVTNSRVHNRTQLAKNSNDD